MLLSLHLTQNYVINGKEKTMRLIDAEKFEVFDATCQITKGIRSGKTAAYFYGEGCRKVLEAIDAAPTIDSESLRPTAKWENGDDYYGDDIIWFCSACKNDVVLRGGTPEEYSYRYCPNCGARMVNTDEKHCT